MAEHHLKEKPFNVVGHADCMLLDQKGFYQILDDYVVALIQSIPYIQENLGHF